MKKGIIYIAFFITFLNGITLNQFSKVTFLFTHYIEHYHRNPGIGVIEFLRMHYWGQDINDNDGDKDRQLPFREFDANAAHHLIFTIPEPPRSNLTEYFFKRNYSLLSFKHYSNPAISSPFKPPCVG